MKLENQIRRSMWDYPDMYKTRSDVLHHLFIVNGNGYEWQNGQLVDYVSYPRRKKKAPIDEIYADTPDGQRMRANFRDLGDDDNPRHQKFLEEMREADKRRDRISRKHHIKRRTLIPCFSKRTRLREAVYPLCVYAKVVNIPDDIQPDWARGAQESIDLIMATTRSTYQQWVGKAMQASKPDDKLTQEQADALHAKDLEWGRKAQARLDEVLAKRAAS